jgi:hypothetical protein
LKFGEKLNFEHFYYYQLGIDQQSLPCYLYFLSLCFALSKTERQNFGNSGKDNQTAVVATISNIYASKSGTKLNSYLVLILTLKLRLL